MHEIPSPQGHLRVCRCRLVVLARVAVLVVAGTVAASCVNLKYPPGASRDGGDAASAVHLGNGHQCKGPADCQSGNCVDSYCCKTACGDPCFSCAIQGQEGVCMPAAMGTDPRDDCKDTRADDPMSCGTNGFCDGAGACQTYAAGTICAEASCVVKESMLVGRCSADGVCVAGQTRDCAPYACDFGAKCRTTCSKDDDCANGHTCDVVAGSCGKKALGTSCLDKSECNSGVCAQGVCCLTDCAGGCVSCALPGSEGACTPVTAGSTPPDKTACPASAATTCGLDGTCDGAGACRNYPTGVTCSPASCSGATLRAAGTCDGKAHCQVPATSTCGGYLCGSATACGTSCASDADCASPSVCGVAQGACGGLLAQYFRQTNLTDLAFSRTDAEINFNWGLGSPNPALNVDNFSVRWRGKLTARFSEDYTFFAATDDGERLFINGAALINKFIRKASVPEDVSPTVHLTAGQPVDIVFEYFESGGDASAVLSWSSKSETKAVIPTSALSPQ
jgi:hypothetical protein